MTLIRDSSYASLREAIAGTKAPAEVVASLALVDVTYHSFDCTIHTGQLVVHKAFAQEVQAIFAGILWLGFPLAKVIPIVHYDWDDNASMADNNSSCFNYRPIAGTTKLSWHALGRAIDLNPMQNPIRATDGSHAPPHAVHNPSVPGTLFRESPVVTLFKMRGWEWGGDWNSPVDVQHFEKKT